MYEKGIGLEKITKIKEIEKRNPFNLKIDEIISLEANNAVSGESFQVITKNGAKYKLRYCRNLKRAKEIEKNVKLLPEAFPRFYGRKGRFLLFKWIKGKEPKKNLSLKLCYELGKLVGKAHSLNEIRRGFILIGISLKE